MTVVDVTALGREDGGEGKSVHQNSPKLYVRRDRGDALTHDRGEEFRVPARRREKLCREPRISGISADYTGQNVEPSASAIDGMT